MESTKHYSTALHVCVCLQIENDIRLDWRHHDTHFRKASVGRTKNTFAQLSF